MFCAVLYVSLSLTLGLKFKSVIRKEKILLVDLMDVAWQSTMQIHHRGHIIFISSCRVNANTMSLYNVLSNNNRWGDIS